MVTSRPLPKKRIGSVPQLVEHWRVKPLFMDSDEVVLFLKPNKKKAIQSKKLSMSL